MGKVIIQSHPVSIILTLEMLLMASLAMNSLRTTRNILRLIANRIPSVLQVLVGYKWRNAIVFPMYRLDSGKNRLLYMKSQLKQEREPMLLLNTKVI